jgi:hypothetical protein
MTTSFAYLTEAHAIVSAKLTRKARAVLGLGGYSAASAVCRWASARLIFSP